MRSCLWHQNDCNGKIYVGIDSTTDHFVTDGNNQIFTYCEQAKYMTSFILQANSAASRSAGINHKWKTPPMRFILVEELNYENYLVEMVLAQ